MRAPGHPVFLGLLRTSPAFWSMADVKRNSVPMAWLILSETSEEGKKTGQLCVLLNELHSPNTGWQCECNDHWNGNKTPSWSQETNTWSHSLRGDWSSVASCSVAAWPHQSGWISSEDAPGAASAATSIVTSIMLHIWISSHTAGGSSSAF